MIYKDQLVPTGELLNTGMTALGFLHADTHRPTRAPQWFVEALAAAMK